MNIQLKGYILGYKGTVAALGSRIRELETRDYPTELSRSLLRTLLGAIQASEKVVDSLAADAEEKVARSTVVRHGQLLSLIHQLTHLVSTSIGDDVPRWAIQPMKYEVSKYIKESVDILMVGGDEGGNFAYDYRLDHLRTILASALGDTVAGEITSQLPTHMAVFHFPFGERDNVLAHGAFFHEVAHQIDIGIRGISERVVQRYLQENDTQIREAVRLQSEPLLRQFFGGASNEGDQRSIDDEQSEILLETITKTVQNVMVQWSKEFCADLLATRILGPAYAIVVVISPALLANLRHHSPSHPSTLLRLKVILDLLGSAEAGDFFTASKSALERAGMLELLERWRAQCSSAKHFKMRWHRSLELVTPELHESIVQFGLLLSARMLEAVVEETQDQQYYSPSQFDKDMQQVLPLLEDWITINERIDYKKRVHTPNAVSTIYNVGFAKYLQEDTSDGRARIAQLLRKSIELSQVQQVLSEPTT